MSGSIDDPRKRFRFLTPAIWLIACLVVQLALTGQGVGMGSASSHWIWLGSMWAGWAGCLWLTSAISTVPSRLLVIVVVGLWHAWWMSSEQAQPMLRYAITFGGFGVAQTLLFRAFRVPTWSSVTFRLNSIPDTNRQFSILDLLLLTTFAALLITAIKRYEPPAESLSWSGLGFVYLSLSFISTFAVLVVRSPLRVWYAVLLIPLIAFGSLCLAWLESAQSITVQRTIYWWPYYVIQGTFAMQMVCLAICGQADRILERTELEEEVKTQVLTSSSDDASPSSSDLLPFRR